MDESILKRNTSDWEIGLTFEAGCYVLLNSEQLHVFKSLFKLRLILFSAQDKCLRWNSIAFFLFCQLGLIIAFKGNTSPTGVVLGTISCESKVVNHNQFLRKITQMWLMEKLDSRTELQEGYLAPAEKIGQKLSRIVPSNLVLICVTGQSHKWSLS